MNKSKIKSKFIKYIYIALGIGTISSCASIFFINNNSNFVNENSSNLSTKTISSKSNNITNGEISNDFARLGNSFKIWNINKTDPFNQNLAIGSSANEFKFHTQLEIIDAVVLWSVGHYNNWIVNSLNTLNSGLKQLNYSKNLNLSTTLQNMINNSIDSVWSTDAITNSPFIYKQTFGGGTFNPPNRTGNNDTDLSKTQNLYGPSIYSNSTRKWNYFSIGGDTGVHYFNQKMFDYNEPRGKVDGKEQVKYLSNKNYWINKVKNKFEKYTFSLKNNSFSLDELIYKLNSDPIVMSQYMLDTPTYDEAKVKFRVFDATEPNSTLIRNRSVDNWYENNYTDVAWNQNVSTALGVNSPNKISKVSSMWVDFKNLIQVDENATTSYSINGNTNTSTIAPTLRFGWNLELMGALKEAKLLAEYVRSFYDNWTSIINFSNSLKNSFTNLINDIYNEKVGIEVVQNFVNQIKTTNGVKDDYTPSTMKAEYVTILEKNNWDLQTKTGNINSTGFSNIAQTISNWALPYDYVLPQVFKNDIYCNYKIEGSNNWNTNELTTKIYDGATKQWLGLPMIDYGVQKQNYNNDISMWVKNFYMKDVNSNSLIAGKNASNTTLDAYRIYSLSKDQTKTKIAWDSSQSALKVTWKWNPGLQLVSQINTGTKTKSLDTPWYFASQYFEDDTFTVGRWKDLTDKLLKLPTISAIQPLSSFKLPNILNSQWSKYPELVEFNNLANELNRCVTLNKLNKEYYDARRNINNLGYIYINVDSIIPLNYYLTDAEYKRLQADNTFIENGKSYSGNYQYFVKYSFKAKPLQLSNLNKYLNISWTSSNSKDPRDLYANKNLRVSFNTKLMKQDLANMTEIDQSYFTLTTNQLNEFFDYSYDDFWNEVIKLINSKTGIDWKLTPDSFRFQSDGTNITNPVDTDKVVEENNNWIYSSRWNYSQNSNQTLNSLTFNCNLIVKFKETTTDSLNDYVTIQSGDVEISQFGEVNQQLENSINIKNEIENLRNQLNNESSKLSNLDLKVKQKQLEIQKFIKNEINKSESLKQKFEAIQTKYATQIQNIINDVKRRYEIFQNDNTFVSNGFVSSTLNKTFDYKNDLEQLKSLFESMNNEMSSVLSDKAIKDEIKTKVDELTNDLKNQIMEVQTNIQNIENNISNLVLMNSNLGTYVEQMNLLESNQKITLKFNTNNIILFQNFNDLGNWSDDYWAYKIDANQNYKSIINKFQFINKLNQIVNDTFESILETKLKFTKDMFNLVKGKNQLTGFVCNDYTKTQTTIVNYEIDASNKLTKLEFEINLNNNVGISRGTQLDIIKEKLSEIKKQLVMNNFEFESLNNLKAGIDSTLNDQVNLINGFGDVDLPNIFGSSQQAADIQKQIDNYKNINVNKTKLNDGFIGTLVASIVVGLLLIVGIGIFLNSLRRNKAKKFSQQEIDEINKVVEDFKNNNKE